METERWTPTDTAGEGLAAHEGPVPEEPSPTPISTFWAQAFADVLRFRRTIAVVVGIAIAASVTLSLMLQNEYRAYARVLTPDQSSGMLSSILGSSSARTAARFLGGGATVGQYTRQLAILTSRSVSEAVVDTFDLVRVYDLAEKGHPREEAILLLQKRASFGVDNEFEFLSLSVQDQSPQRAADMTNMYVRLLNRTNSDLQTRNARSYRSFIETRYLQANAQTDSLLDRVQAFQRRYGVFDLPAQTQSYFTSLGALRSQQARLQVEREALRAQLGPDSPELQSADQALAEATRLYEQALAGSEQSLPVARAAVPSVAREYAEIERSRLIQQATLEAITPMYEAAKMEETRVTDAVQIVDLAVAPTRKVWPKRSVIVIVSTLSALLAACVAALMVGQWKRHGASFRQSLRDAQG